MKAISLFTFSGRRPTAAFLAALALPCLGLAEPAGQQTTSSTRLQLQLDSSAVHLQWDSDGILESTDQLGSGWKTASDAAEATAKGATLPLSSKQRFFRIRERDGSFSQIIPIVPGLPEQAPVFDPIRLGQFDGSKVGIQATLKEGQRNPGQLVPYFVDDQVVFLHDDGKNGDSTAGDGVFAGEAPLEAAELDKMVKFIDGLPEDRRQQPVFDGRAVATDRSIDLTKTRNAIAGFLDGTTPVLTLPPSGLAPITPLPAPTKPPVVVAPPIPPPGGGASGTGLNPCNQWPTWQKCLMITDLSVVEDPVRTFDPCSGQGTPMGAWTFGRLMTDMAGAVPPADFARRWLRTWEIDQSVNNDVVPNRQAGMAATVLAAWEANSGGPGKALDMSKAPFRLLAIVNRLDLRGNFSYGATVPDDPCNPACTTGEGRFVFCFCGSGQGGGYGGGGTGTGGGTAKTDGTPAGGRGEFLVILEYCIPKQTCRELHAYAQEWANLQCVPFGPVYNNLLQRITDQFASAGAAPGHPNNSALNQLRTNENLLDPLWELREFKIFKNDSDAGHLRPVTVKQTPNGDVDGTVLLQNFVTTVLPAPPSHTVPLEWSMGPGFQSQPFLGGHAIMAPVSTVSGSPAWATTGATVPNILRHDFALNTCNGCHDRETATPFVHVGCRAPGQTAPLSGFLIGNGTGGPLVVTVPGSPATTVQFFDLQRREQDLVNFLLTPCGLTIFSQGLQAVH